MDENCFAVVQMVYYNEVVKNIPNVMILKNINSYNDPQITI